MTKTNKEKLIENAEYGVDSRYHSKKERELDATALMEARLLRMKKVSKGQIIRAKLLQLKLKMELHLKNAVYDEHNYFLEFLEKYIDTIYTKRTDFAKDIGISPVSLSQVINNHRAPNEEFLLKLMLHSEMIYKNVCVFHEKIWYQIYFQQKISDTMYSKRNWKSEVEKFVGIQESMINNV